MSTNIPRAKAPSRASAKLTLTYGPLSVPVAIYAGVDDKAQRWVKRSEYTTDGEKVGRAPVIYDDEGEPRLLTNEDVKRCVETEHGLVELTDDEMREVLDLTEGEARIESFVPLYTMGTGRFMPEQLMQVRPVRGKQRGSFDPVSAKGFALLVKTMRESQTFALVNMALRDRPSYAALLPTGRMLRLMFDDEVREDLPMPDVKVKPEDVQMMRDLIEVSETPPPLTNLKRQLLIDYVEDKGKRGETIDNQEATTEPEQDAVEKMVERLRESKRAT